VYALYSEALRGVDVIRAFKAEQVFLRKHLDQLSQNMTVCHCLAGGSPRTQTPDTVVVLASLHVLQAFMNTWAATSWVTFWLELLGCFFIGGAGEDRRA